MKIDPSIKIPRLITYAYSRKDSDEWIDFEYSHPGLEVILDSGAFSALNAGHVISLDEYIDFLHKWKHRLFGYLALDVLGDPIATERNLHKMIDAGLKPIPVHVRGEGQARMDELFTVSDWVALGGLRRPKRGAADETYIKQKMEWAAGRNVHWLGFTKQEMVLKYRPYSVDSASCSSAFLYGRVEFYLGKGKWVGYNRVDAPKIKFTKAMIDLISDCGVTVEEVKNPDTWRRRREEGVTGHSAAVITMLSYMRYAQDLFKHVGTRFYLAGYNLFEMYRFLAEAHPTYRVSEKIQWVM